MDSVKPEATEETVKCSWWSAAEHELFVKALEHYGKNWRKIAQEVGSRSISQVRSHAQKYFMKLKRRSLREQAKKEALLCIEKDEKTVPTLVVAPECKSEAALSYENYILRNYIQALANVNHAFAQEFRHLFPDNQTVEDFTRCMQPAPQYQYFSLPNTY